MSPTQSKVYDHDVAKVRDSIVDVFRQRKGEATTNDLVAVTGLPKVQVETEIRSVADEYGARLRVTESGEVLYSFPDGMTSRYRGFLPGLRRGWKAFKKGAAKVGTFLFKIWIVVMLVGYFVFFLALALLALVLSLVAQVAGRDDSDRGDGILGLYFIGRLFDTIINIWFYSELFMSDEDRALRAQRRRDKKPLHKAIYSFVFGDGDPNAGWDAVEKKAVIAFLQSHKGVMTMPEFMAISGLSPLDADEAINAYLLEFEGEPLVTDGGTIYYSFPGLLRRKDRLDRSFGGTVPMKRIAAFSVNNVKSNRTFCILNAVNLAFGSYFLVQSQLAHPALQAFYNGARVRFAGGDGFYSFTHIIFTSLGMHNPAAFIGSVLGIAPVAFAILFYIIPAVRKARLDDRNEKTRLENLRRVAYRAALSSPSSIRPESIPVMDDAARPKDGRAAEKLLTELAAWSGADPGTDGSFRFTELERGKAEIEKLRASIDTSAYDLGGISFDSGSRVE